MPLYYYKCPYCHDTKRRLFPDEDVASKTMVICQCGEAMERAPVAPTAKSVETLDNGVMPRRLERLADAEQIFHERAHGKKGNI